MGDFQDTILTGRELLSLTPWFLAAAGLSALLLAILARTSLARHFADMPGHRKVHQTAVPRLGGIGIVLAFLILVAVAQVFGFRDMRPGFLLSVTFASLFILVAGAFDDALSLGFRSKFILQFLVSGVVVNVFGLGFDRVALFGYEMSLGGLGVIVSIIWMVGLMNAVNLIDGIDGLAGGVALVGLLGVALLSYGAGAGDSLAVCVVAGGATLGFLYFNFNKRRKIFLGDTGSQFLGALLAILIFEIHDMPGVSHNALVPLLLVGYPLLDVSVAMVRRFVRVRSRELGQRVLSMFLADSDHIHHRLLRAGLSHVQATGLLLSLASGFTAAAIVIPRADWRWELAITVYLLVATAFLLNRLGFLQAGKARRALRSWVFGERQGDAMGARYARYYEIFASSDAQALARAQGAAEPASPAAEKPVLPAPLAGKF